MKSFPKPYCISFQSHGKSAEGFISVSEFDKLIPFKVQRSFWTYYTPENIIRGRHALCKTEQVLLAVAGRITLTTELTNGEKETFILEKPDKGVYIPPDAWHTMQYSHNAVQLVFASTLFDEKDYIRDYEIYKKICR